MPMKSSVVAALLSLTALLSVACGPNVDSVVVIAPPPPKLKERLPVPPSDPFAEPAKADEPKKEAALADATKSANGNKPVP